MGQGSEPVSFANRLLSNETVVWWGQPHQGLLLTARDGFLVPFSLLWGGFAIFWETTALNTNAPVVMKLWGIPFVFVGLFMIGGRFVVDAWLRRTCFYAVTERRILIARAGPWPSFQALGLDRLPEVTLNEGTGRRGTITFGAALATWPSGRSGTGLGYWLPSLGQPLRFLAIADADEVFALVQRLSNPSSPPPQSAERSGTAPR